MKRREFLSYAAAAPCPSSLLIRTQLAVHPVDDGDRCWREQSPGIGSERLHREENAHLHVHLIPRYKNHVEDPEEASATSSRRAPTT